MLGLSGGAGLAGDPVGGPELLGPGPWEYPRGRCEKNKNLWTVKILKMKSSSAAVKNSAVIGLCCSNRGPGGVAGAAPAEWPLGPGPCAVIAALALAGGSACPGKPGADPSPARTSWAGPSAGAVLSTLKICRLV